MTFEEVFDAYEWRPIRDCPGRYTLDDSAEIAKIEDIAGDGALVGDYDSSECEDRVLVSQLVGGGAIISYLRPDNTQLHTLNDQSGFERKIKQLKIALDGRA